jgi:hypothetical protein
MAEKKGAGPEKDKKFDPDERFRYIGFEIETGKIGDHFKSDAEKESWVKRTLEKRKKGVKLRDETSFDKPRVAGYEKIVLTITSVVLIASLFLPWFSGYKEYEVVAKTPALRAEDISAGTSGDALIPDSAVIEGNEGLPASGGETQMAAPKDEKGFSSMTGVVKRRELKKEFYSSSALGAIGSLGMVFSSGLVLKITGLLYIFYILLCLGMAGLTLYTLYGTKIGGDELAIKLKALLKYGWISPGIWFFCLILSFFGASYSFDPTGMLKQLGTSYSVVTYLGLLGYGFYISLACFIMSAAKAVEI